jgi:alanine racemase
MSYRISEINDIIKGKRLNKAGGDPVVKHLLIDSRKISTIEDTLFFAIEGERHNGHAFIAELYEKGIRNFVVSDPESFSGKYVSAHFIQVENCLRALQELCAMHRQRFDYPVIGITGSNGKTIVKEWLFQLLREDNNIVRSPKSFNSQVGVPLSVWQMGREHTLGIFEAGISQTGEMEHLENIIKPSIGILTNIGQAHSENFENNASKTNEKLKLFQDCEHFIYCKDYPGIQETVSQWPHVQAFTWSRRSRAGLQIGKVTRLEQETHIQGIYNNDFINIRIPFTDEASIENAIHCWALMLLFKYDHETIGRRMMQLSPVAMRLEMKEGVNNCSIINDSYNSDLGSLGIALDFLNQQKQYSKRTLILSDILQTGKEEAQLYREVADLISRKNISRLIGIGEAISRQADCFRLDKQFYSSTADFLKQYHASFFNNEIILIKGARAFGFEQISKILQQKAHETILEINMNAMVANLNYYRSKLKSGTKVMAMVKAFSYGSGSSEIASMLQFNRIDYLAVAYADEGIELRKAGITVPIMVMNPEEQSYDAMIEHKLEPEIFSFRVLNLFCEAASRSALKDQKIPVHLKIDTGMHRLGFEAGDINELIIRIRNNKNIVIRSVFSHLAGSDEKEHEEFTKLQIERFTGISLQILSHFEYPILRHILNSGGVNHFAHAQFDMIRLGIGMYGISSNDFEQMNLQHVSTLKTNISQIKNLDASETVGYSRKGILKKNSHIATVPIGYADGYNRRLGNGNGKMLVNGQFAPTVGNICMDMCMIDVSDIPSCQEGDEVIVFGEQYPISEIAKAAGTIPYEILTTISRRVKRVYYQE